MITFLFPVVILHGDLSKKMHLKTGDPKDEDTFIGPLISEKEAIRLENWINSAIKRGAFGIRVTKKSDLENAIKEALKYDGPSLVEIITDPLLI